eukprot:gb/GECG01002990.1/.p1 GENE.gb/GECG01002990.1/~~gb/GECG01002990.1/.p1  ORF type:complete len:590 (+),score=47.31 gb/GECG01002990.1/:1-1770(+)
MLLLFILSFYVSRRLKLAITIGQSLKKPEFMVIDQDQDTISLKEQALDFFRKKKNRRKNYTNSGRTSYVSDPRTSWSSVHSEDPTHNSENGAQLAPTSHLSTSQHNHQPHRRSPGVSKLQSSMHHALGLWTLAGVLWGVSFISDQLIAEDGGEISEPLSWWDAYFSILRSVEVLSTMGVLVSVGTRSKRTPRCKPFTLDTLCGWTCCCFVQCHSNLNDGILSHTVSTRKKCQVRLLNAIGRCPKVEAASFLTIGEGNSTEEKPFSNRLESNLRSRLKRKAVRAENTQHRTPRYACCFTALTLIICCSVRSCRVNQGEPKAAPCHVYYDTEKHGVKRNRKNTSNVETNASAHSSVQAPNVWIREEGTVAGERAFRKLEPSSSRNTVETNPERPQSTSLSVATELTQAPHQQTRSRSTRGVGKNPQRHSIGEHYSRSRTNSSRRNTWSAAERPSQSKPRSRLSVGGTRVENGPSRDFDSAGDCSLPPKNGQRTKTVSRGLGAQPALLRQMTDDNRRGSRNKTMKALINARSSSLGSHVDTKHNPGSAMQGTNASIGAEHRVTTVGTIKEREAVAFLDNPLWKSSGATPHQP